jgi:hypothetical protein
LNKGRNKQTLNKQTNNMIKYMNTKRKSQKGEKLRWVKERRSGFDSWHGAKDFLFSTESRPALGPTETPIQRALGGFFSGG